MSFFLMVQLSDFVLVPDQRELDFKSLAIVSTNRLNTKDPVENVLSPEGAWWWTTELPAVLILKDLMPGVRTVEFYIKCTEQSRVVREFRLRAFRGNVNDESQLINSDLWDDVLHITNMGKEGEPFEGSFTLPPQYQEEETEYWRVDFLAASGNRGVGIQHLGLKSPFDVVKECDNTFLAERQFFAEGLPANGIFLERIHDPGNMMILYGSKTFPITVTVDGDYPRHPVGAGAYVGSGRMVVFANNEYIEKGGADRTDDLLHQTLIKNSLRWLTEGKRAPLKTSFIGFNQQRVNRLCSLFPILSPAYYSGECTEKSITAAVAANPDLILYVQIHGAGTIDSNINRADAVSMRQFVNNGGSLLLTQTSWRWRNWNNQADVGTYSIVNHIISIGGMAFTNYPLPEYKIGLAIPAVMKGVPVHLGRALKMIWLAQKQNIKVPPAVSGVVSSALQNLPSQLRIANRKGLDEDVNAAEFAKLLAEIMGVEESKQADQLHPKLLGASVGPLRSRGPPTFDEDSVTFPIKQKLLEGFSVFSTDVLAIAKFGTIQSTALASTVLQCPAIPGVKQFPGIPGPTSRRLGTVVHRLTIASFLKQWQSTGLYVIPGEPIFATMLEDALLELPQKPADLKIRVRIGCHTDSLHKKEELDRWPDVTLFADWWPFRPSQNTNYLDSVMLTDSRYGSNAVFASPYGGLLYFEVIDTGGFNNDNLITFEISGGATKVPWFSLSRQAQYHNTQHYSEVFPGLERLDMIQDAGQRMLGYYPDMTWEEKLEEFGDVPFGEVESELIIFSMPVSSLKSLSESDLVKALKLWDIALSAELGIASQKLERKERVAFDIQISAGYMHSGYPVMTYLSACEPSKNSKRPKPLDYTLLEEGDQWGLFHELGHNRQKGWWTPGCVVEVTVNIFSLTATWAVSGKTPYKAGWFRDQKEEMLRYLKSDNKHFQTASNEARLGVYGMYLQHFGLAAMTKVFKAYEQYEATNKELLPRDEQDKWDMWVRESCKAVNYDLRPYYEKWGFPFIDNNVQSVCQNFPVYKGFDIIKEIENL